MEHALLRAANALCLTTGSDSMPMPAPTRVALNATIDVAAGGILLGIELCFDSAELDAETAMQRWTARGRGAIRQNRRRQYCPHRAFFGGSWPDPLGAGRRHRRDGELRLGRGLDSGPRTWLRDLVFRLQPLMAHTPARRVGSLGL
ncbi:MAG TPA: hypothetical protein VMM78_17465 [Thermomicrobiales bacterium]|nr:hypothetical protein [Thermomicrobiales bacterium]